MLPENDFEAELRKNVTKELLSDAAFCDELYAAMCNMTWVRKEWDHERRLADNWSCSWRSSGAILAEMRGDLLDTGENYLDFYCAGNEGIVSDRIREFCRSFGWEPFPWDEIEAQHADR